MLVEVVEVVVVELVDDVEVVEVEVVVVVVVLVLVVLVVEVVEVLVVVVLVVLLGLIVREHIRDVANQVSVLVSAYAPREQCFWQDFSHHACKDRDYPIAVLEEVFHASCLQNVETSDVRVDAVDVAQNTDHQ